MKLATNRAAARLSALAAAVVLGTSNVFAQGGTITVDPGAQVSTAIDTVNTALGLLVPAAFVMIAITLLIRQTRKKLNG